MNLLKTLTSTSKRREATGPLSGRTLHLDRFQIKVEALIGEGGCATIYRGVDLLTQDLFAIKHFRLSGDPEAERDVQTEVAVMRALRDCPHTLSLCEFVSKPGEALLLLDLCEGTLAAEVMTRGGEMSHAEVMAAFLPVAQAVAAMHGLEPPLAHRDVKAENVLRHPQGGWVLCDFGSATPEQRVYESAVEISREEERVRKHTTPAYRAPEVS